MKEKINEYEKYINYITYVRKRGQKIKSDKILYISSKY